VLARLERRVARVRISTREWTESRDASSASGVAIAAWRRYEAVDGPQQTAGLILLLLVQLNELGGNPSWANLALAPAWVALLAVFFAWAGRLLTHDRVSRRDLLPGAVVTAVGLVALMLFSSVVMELWVNLYARDYGGFGVVMAIFFWIAMSSGVMVWSAALSPALAARRALRAA
jgi:membrane protein